MSVWYVIMIVYKHNPPTKDSLIQCVRLLFLGRNFKIDLANTVNSYSASHDNWCTVGGDGGCRVGEVRDGTTSPMPDHKSFKLQ